MFDAELDRLLAGLCDGTLSDEETRQLGERIATSETDRRAYLQYLDLHVALLGEAPFAGVTESLGNLDRLVQLPQRQTAGRRARRRWAMLAAAVAAVLVAVVGLQWWNAEPGNRGIAKVAPYARITDVVGSVQLDGLDQQLSSGVDLVDGQTVRTGADDSFAAIELADGSRFLLCPESQLRISSDALSPARLRLILSAGVLEANVPKLQDDQQLLVVTPQAEIAIRDTHCVVSAPDSGSTAVETSNGQVSVLRTADGTTAEVPAGFYAVAVHNEPNLAVRPVAQLPTQPHAQLALEMARSLAYRGKTAIVAASADRLAAFDRSTGELQHSRPLSKEASFQLLVSASGNFFGQGERGGRWQFFEPQTGDSLGRLETGNRNLNAAAINDRGNLLAVADQRSGRAFTVRRWDLEGPKELPAIEVQGRIFALAMSCAGDRLALGLEKTKGFANHRLEIWQANPPELLARVDLPERPLRVLTFSPDGAKLAGANDRGSATVWDAATGAELLQRGAVEGWTHPLTALAFAPAGDLLAAGSNNGRVRLWNTSSGEELGVLTCGTRIISALAFSPEGDELAVGAVRGKVLLYRLPAAHNGAGEL